MQDIIQLLPDNIANQIAAGEVVQRPASVVKELLENALDAGAKKVILQVKDGGKTLLRVIDDGKGMSPTDARMSFERHATSKIRSAEDLFKVQTMGFRGEALASIASVAQVELKTRRPEDEMGTLISINGSLVKKQEPVQAPPGTSVSVKQLFYNIPARRKFLKSDAVELKHIIEEFKRVALANPQVFFSLYNKDNELFHLPTGPLKQRIIHLLGKKYEGSLLPVDEEVDDIQIKGWVSKPEHTRQRKTDTYLFVNDRFIKSAYLHHAVKTAYGDLIDANVHPPYVLFLTIDPARIDVNVHPTKQEIKFDDERLVYNYVRVAVRHALGQFSLSPLIDFENAERQRTLTGPAIIDEQHRTQKAGIPSFGRHSAPSTPDNWTDLYEILKSNPPHDPTTETLIPELEGQNLFDASIKHRPVLIHNRFIASSIKDGLVLIHKKNALARIFYEELMATVEQGSAATQQELFPITMTLSKEDVEVMHEIVETIRQTGFDVEHFGEDTFIIRGVPAELSELGTAPNEWIESLIEAYKNEYDQNASIKERVVKNMAISRARYHNKPLETEELTGIIDRLFACDMPKYAPDGKRCFITYQLEELENNFNR